MGARFNREDRVKSEVEQLGRLVFPPFASHLSKRNGRHAAFAGWPQAKAQGPQRILFIEDDRFIADMYRMGLEGGGWDIEVAYDGEEGLRRALEDPPSLILLDLLLPRLDGIEVLRRLRMDPNTSRIPVLIVSNASGLGGRDEEARRLGINDWMVKANTTPAALAKRVSRILGND
jgi:CheY-like chemotaxis protein